MHPDPILKIMKTRSLGLTFDNTLLLDDDMHTLLIQNRFYMESRYFSVDAINDRSDPGVTSVIITQLKIALYIRIFALFTKTVLSPHVVFV